MSHYNSALEINPNYASAHNGLGNSLVRLGRLDEAVAHYNKALEINPNYAAAHFNLGRTLQRMGQEDEAADHLRRASEIDAQRGSGTLAAP